MRRTLTLSTCAALLALTGCASNAKPASSDAAPSAASSTTAPAAPAAAPLTASTAMAKLAAIIPTAKLTGVVTEANDDNHLLGRPHQYTSKITFKDTRITDPATAYLKAGDVELGGSIEVFANPEDAAARTKYIQAVTASIPAFAEYDYMHGDVLVRVSKYLTPTQAKAFEAAAQQLG